MIHIEITLSEYKKGTWNMRVGDISDNTEIHNASKEDILEVISQEMDGHIEAEIDK